MVQSITIPPAMIRYGDIIMQGRPVHCGDVFSRRHPKMTRQHRAKIFAPYDALRGMYGRLRQVEETRTERVELSERSVLAGEGNVDLLLCQL